MTTLAGLNTVLAPPATPPVYGLLKAATIVTNDEEWHGGVKWTPEQLGGGFTTCVDCNGLTEALDQGDNPPLATAEPFLIYAEDHCSTIGFKARDYEARARRQLAAVESALIAREFQMGAQRDDCELANTVLEDAVDLGGSGHTIADGFALLEQALAEAFLGRRSMIHVTPATMVLAKAGYLVDLVGGQWVTALGTIVVADAGYRPVDGDVFIYGTTLVQIRQSPVMVPSTFEESTDRATNTVLMYAERFTLVQFDSAKDDTADALFKIEVDTPVLSGS